MGNCNECSEKRKLNPDAPVPYFIYEEDIDREERHTKRWMITTFILLGIIFSMIIGFLIYESQFETYYYEQDGEGVNIVGNENEVNPNESNSDRQEAETTSNN